MEKLNPTEIHHWLKDNELYLMGSLQNYIKCEGDINSGDGREDGIFTGKNYSDAAAFILLQSVQRRFGKSPIWLVSTIINQRPCTWIRFNGTDGQYFMYPTYGEINRSLRTVIFDRVEDEGDYLHYQEKPMPFIANKCPLRLEKYIFEPVRIA